MKRHGLDVWSRVFFGILLLFFGVFLLYPVALILRRGFGLEGQWTLRHFLLIFESPLLRESLLNSLWIAAMTTVLATGLALPLAHWLTRYQFRGRGVLNSLLLVPMIMPPFVGAIGLKQLLGRFGTLNLALGRLGVECDVDWLGNGGLTGIILLQVFSLFPVLLLNLSAAMANVDPALREAAQSLGAPGWRLFRTITLPLILPGWFAGAILVFIGSFTDLGTPLVFGYGRVVPVQIFDAVNDLNTNPQGYALVMVVLLITAVLFVLSRRWVGSRRYEMLSRGHTQGGEVPADGWTTCLIWGISGPLIVMALLPHLAVVLQSLSERWFFSVLPSAWTARNFVDVFDQNGAALAIRNSLFYSSLSAVVDLFLGVLIAWLLTRRRVRFAGILDVLAMMPLALPGLVLAFGYVAAFDFDAKQHPWFGTWMNPRENPTLLLIISYSVRRLPYIVRSAYAGFQQTSVSLEEASASLGASPWTTLRRITLPLVSAHLVAGTVLTFSFAMLEVSDSLILAQREKFYPITKQLWQVMGRIDPNAPGLASALGVVGMILLTGSLLVAGRLLGKRLGQLFRA